MFNVTVEHAILLYQGEAQPSHLLGQHPIILGKPWMQKHGVILNMSCDKLTF